MSRVVSAALAGVDGLPVEVEVRLSSQLPRVDVVGLPEAAVRESAARVRAAIASSGRRFPDRRVTVNLAPASIRKSGASLDLPIAVGILAAAGEIEPSALQDVAFAGELALDGRLRPLRGALAIALAVRQAGCSTAIVPEASAREAALTPNLRVLAAATLDEVLSHLAGATALATAEPLVPDAPSFATAPDLRDVHGQEAAKRALLVSAAGGHALLLVGPPGSGKTMLARRLPGLLPALDLVEAIDVTRIHGVAHRTSRHESAALVLARPFRSPHHTASAAGILGGGSPPLPGEVSLAHRGVLFLDELPEFERRVLESLRQVLEERRVVVARARHSVVFPAQFQLVAAANPCPCGFRLSRDRDCRCDDATIARYTARLSGPLLDRIDLHVRVPGVPWRELDRAPDGPNSAELRARIDAARQRQLARLAALGAQQNAEIPDGALDALVDATPEARALLGRCVDRFALSARSVRRVLRVARTIADLAGETRTTAPAVAEALAWRPEGAVRDPERDRPISDTP